jgi:cysteinyl-tRNA synthetase
LHNGFVNVDGEKMSKSLGNFWTIRDILERIDPLVLRFALINAHYRSPIDMNEALLHDAERNHGRLIEAYAKALRGRTSNHPVALPQPDVTSQDPLSKGLGLMERMAQGFALAMDDDFNSREAIAKVLGGVREATRLLDADLDEADANAVAHYCVAWFEELAGDVLGVLPSPDVLLAEPEEDPRRAEVADEVEALLLQRAEARLAKDWPAADAIRNRLAAMGVEVTDTADGPVWALR